jgi:hypothetical protein
MHHNRIHNPQPNGGDNRIWECLIQKKEKRKKAKYRCDKQKIKIIVEYLNPNISKYRKPIKNAI